MKFLCQPILILFWGYQKHFWNVGVFCSNPTIKEISMMSALSLLRDQKSKFQWYLPLSIENKQYSDYHMTFKSQAPFKHFQGLHNSYTRVSSITLNKIYNCYGLNYRSITRGNFNCKYKWQKIQCMNLIAENFLGADRLKHFLNLHRWKLNQISQH